MPSDSPASSPILNVLRGERQWPPPIWLMRQAGRYLPEYRELRAKAGSFLDLCYSPEMACEVTLQPLRRFELDAAILFADILLIPHALGQDLTFVEGEGPRLAPPLAEVGLSGLSSDRLHDHLAPVYETVRLLAKALPQDKALIGFAGAPWTVATYMIAGQATKDHRPAVEYAYRNPSDFSRLMDILCDATVEYLSRQIEAGAQVVQLFDSWAGAAPDAIFEIACVNPSRRISAALKEKHPGTPQIIFPKGVGARLTEYLKLGYAAIGIDQNAPASWVQREIQSQIPVQGALDPVVLIAGGDALDRAVGRQLAAYGGGRYIFNLGHGISLDTPIDHVARLVERVKSAR